MFFGRDFYADFIYSPNVNVIVIAPLRLKRPYAYFNLFLEWKLLAFICCCAWKIALKQMLNALLSLINCFVLYRFYANIHTKYMFYVVKILSLLC